MPTLAELKRVTDGFVGELAQRAQQRQLVGSFDLPRLVENRVGRQPINVRQIFLQRGKILCRQKLHLDANLAAIESSNL